MEDNKKSFINIIRLEPENSLKSKVLMRISFEKKRQAKIRLFYSTSVALVSFATFIPSIKYLLTQFSQSGFYQYLSILLFDRGTLGTYWKELGMSLLESLPTLGITLTLALVFVILWTSKFIIRDSKIIFNRIQLA